MMAGRSLWLGGGLAGELVPVARMGCWTSSGRHIAMGSSSIMGRSAWTGGGVGARGCVLRRGGAFAGLESQRSHLVVIPVLLQSPR